MNNSFVPQRTGGWGGAGRALCCTALLCVAKGLSGGAVPLCVCTQTIPWAWFSLVIMVLSPEGLVIKTLPQQVRHLKGAVQAETNDLLDAEPMPGRALTRSHFICMTLCVFIC